MKKQMVFGIILFFMGCTYADRTAPTESVVASPTVTGKSKPVFQIPQSSEQPCVHCQFNEEELEINRRIGKEIEQQRSAYEKLIKAGMSEEEAVRKVYVYKEY